MSRVLCLGDSCVDIIVPYADLLENKDAQILYSCGGANANSAAALGRLNVDVSFAGKAGKDIYGLMMKKELEDRNVDTGNFILDEDMFSTQILIIIDRQKDRHPFLMHRQDPSYLQIYREDLERIDLTDTEYILTNGMMLFEGPAAENITDFLIRAHEKGIKILLDINYRPETIDQDRRYLDKAIQISDYLLGSISDDLLPLTATDNIEDAIRTLSTDTNAIIARNSEGSTVYTKDASYHTDSFKVEVSDTVGAGDAFNAGFIYGLVNNKDLPTCNTYGCAAAALCIKKSGARNTPDENELLDLIADRSAS